MENLAFRQDLRQHAVTNNIYENLSYFSDDAFFYFAVAFIAFSHAHSNTIFSLQRSLKSYIEDVSETSSLLNIIRKFHSSNKLDQLMSKQNILRLVNQFETNYYMISTKIAIITILNSCVGMIDNLSQNQINSIYISLNNYREIT